MKGKVAHYIYSYNMHSTFKRADELSFKMQTEKWTFSVPCYRFNGWYSLGRLKYTSYPIHTISCEVSSYARSEHLNFLETRLANMIIMKLFISPLIYGAKDQFRASRFTGVW